MYTSEINLYVIQLKNQMDRQADCVSRKRHTGYCHQMAIPTQSLGDAGVSFNLQKGYSLEKKTIQYERFAQFEKLQQLQEIDMHTTIILSLKAKIIHTQTQANTHLDSHTYIQTQNENRYEVLPELQIIHSDSDNNRS